MGVILIENMDIVRDGRARRAALAPEKGGRERFMRMSGGHSKASSGVGRTAGGHEPVRTRKIAKYD